MSENDAYSNTEESLPKDELVYRFDPDESRPAAQPACSIPQVNVTVKQPPYPVEGIGNQSFSNTLLGVLIAVVPLMTVSQFGLPWWFLWFLLPVQGLAIFAAYFVLNSHIGVGYHNKVKLPGKPRESYITILDEDLKKEVGTGKISMETFFEAYFDGKIDLADGQDCLDVLEARHDWASFAFGLAQIKFFLLQWIPELLTHSRKQDETQVRDHYDRGDDFYAAFLGPSMVYTSGIISDPAKDESLEELQLNKLKLVSEKLQLQPGEKHLDIGCGWGTLVAYAARYHGTDSTGVTLGLNQTDFGNNRCAEWGVSEKARICCMDYRDIPATKYNKISCLEMAEHVGVRRFQTFLAQVRDLMEDDGLFYMQVAGLRATWQYEDFIWGLFMAKYIFPGADASTPLYWYVKQLEIAGFEVKGVDTVGVHYSATIWRWYQNWMRNRKYIEAKYGKRWFRIWEIFLAWSTIVPRQGGAACFQIVAHKNMNAFDRTRLISKRLVA